MYRKLIAFIKKRNSYFPPLILFVIVFLTYLNNLSASIYGGDAGDLVTAVIVKGVPHPSGYPLFTLLGILFNALPIAQTPAWKVGLISVFSSSFAIVLFYLIIVEVLSKKKNLIIEKRFVAFISGLTLAFVYPFWLYSEIAELFALNNFFTLLLVYLAVLYSLRKKVKYLYFLFFSAGLSLSHHEIVILIFPSLLVLLLYRNFKILKAWKVLLKCFSVFFIGLLPYLYIPIAASKKPLINWDNPSSFKNFINLVSRADYGWKLNTSPENTPLLALKSYFGYLNIELTFILIILFVFGMIWIIKNNKPIFISLLLSLILTGPFSIIYTNTTISNEFLLGVMERFYITSIIFILLFSSFGILLFSEKLIDFLKKFDSSFSRKKSYKIVFILMFTIVPLAFFIKNFPKTNLRNFWLGDYLAYDILSPLPKNSYLLIYGDTLAFNTLYLQNALGVRKDVNITWLGPINHENIYEKERKEVIRKNKGISKDEIDFRIIESLAKKGEVFTVEKRGSMSQKNHMIGFDWIPYGLVYKLAKGRDKLMKREEYLKQQDEIFSKFHLTKPELEKDSFIRSLTLSEIPSLYFRAYNEISLYLNIFYKEMPGSKKYCERILNLNQAEALGYECIGYYYFSKKDCQISEKNLKEAIKLSPQNNRPYIYLFMNYKSCFRDNRKAKEVEKVYRNIFKSEDIKNFY